MIFIYLSEFFMSRIAQQVIPALAPYQESFDIYYTNDQEEASKYFNFKHEPDALGHIVIIDPSRKVALKKIFDPSQLVPTQGDQPLSAGSYKFKSHNPVPFP
jgi:hypothetical protein